MAVWYGQAEITASTRWSSMAAWLAGRDDPAGGVALHPAGGDAAHPAFLWETLNTHADIAWTLVEIFHARFDPAEPRRPACRPTGGADRGSARRSRASTRIASSDAFSTSSSDPADQRLPARRRGRAAPQIVFKLIRAHRGAAGAPSVPRDLRLRAARRGHPPAFGKVARGGIRVGPAADFRTEVLGLAKAQQAKNAVIVPVGAKGGFVPKQLPAPGDRAAFFEEGKAAYSSSSEPARHHRQPGRRRAGAAGRRVRRDGDDPYLVVAADKGTANFSDTANAIAEAHHFWLGDAFASGGSHGYDHKKMGITARGAWEAVKRHFREMDTTSRRRRSRWSASATCRATCSATACCSHRRSGWSPPSTIATSSSIPTRSRRRARRTQRLFRCRGRAGRTMTRRGLGAVAGSSRARKSDP